MSTAQLALFAAAALLLALAPGPDNLAVLALGIARGRAASLGFALGCAAGCLNHTLLVTLGVTALIAASPHALRALQIAGAAYLLWLGLRQTLNAGNAAAATLPPVAGWGAHFRRGLLANLINPKVALFFIAFLPQFVRPEGWPARVQMLVFGILFSTLAALVFTLVALGAARLGAWLRRRPRLSVWLERASGGLFIALGLRLAVTHTPP